MHPKPTLDRDLVGAKRKNKQMCQHRLTSSPHPPAAVRLDHGRFVVPHEPDTAVDGDLTKNLAKREREHLDVFSFHLSQKATTMCDTNQASVLFSDRTQHPFFAEFVIGNNA